MSDSGYESEENEQKPNVGNLGKNVDAAAVQQIEQFKDSIDDVSSKFPADLEYGAVTPEQFNDMLKYLRVVQRKALAQSKFTYTSGVHRYPNLVPYDWNACREHIGSWMGGSIGLTQWPINSKDYTELLLTVIRENDVKMMVALGVQEPEERLEMADYWTKLGDVLDAHNENGFRKYSIKLSSNTNDKDEKGESEGNGDGDEKAEVREKGTRAPVGSNNNNNNNNNSNKSDFTVLHYEKWTDFGVPTEGELETFEKMFRLIKETTAKGHCVLVHCKGGVGRTGTFLTMYRSWLGEITEENFYRKWVELRHFRMEAIQTEDQLNYAARYVTHLKKENSRESQPPPSNRRCISLSELMRTVASGVVSTGYWGVYIALGIFRKRSQTTSSPPGEDGDGDEGDPENGSGKRQK